MRREEEKLHRAGILINEFPWQSLNYAAIAVVTKSRVRWAPSSRRASEGALPCGAGGGLPVWGLPITVLLGLGRAQGWGCAWAGFGKRVRDQGMSIPESSYRPRETQELWF